MKDFYYILGLEPNCTLNEIKEAYRKLSKKLHPDLNQGDKYFESKFRDIKEAWETLRDPVKRVQYDAALKKIKSNPQEQPKQQYQYRQQTYRPRPEATVVPKRKGPGVGMTIVFILISLIFGDYLVRTFNPPKKIITIQTVPANTVFAAKTLKYHKKKHRNKSAADSVKAYAATLQKKPVEPAGPDSQPDAGVNKQTAVANIKPSPMPVKKIMPIFNIKQTINGDGNDADLPVNSSYTTYVKANPTGLVNMRASDSFGSPVIQTIPANAKVVVIARGNTYYRISYNAIAGYVPKWSLQSK